MDEMGESKGDGADSPGRIVSGAVVGTVGILLAGEWGNRQRRDVLNDGVSVFGELIGGMVSFELLFQRIRGHYFGLRCGFR